MHFPLNLPQICPKLLHIFPILITKFPKIMDNMDKNQERTEELKKLFKQAIENKIVVSKGEFAALVGCSFTTMSAAMNGNPKYLSASIVAKADRAVSRAIAEKNGLPLIEEDTQKETSGEEAESLDHSEMRAIVSEVCATVRIMCETLNKERESHERIITSMLEVLKK